MKYSNTKFVKKAEIVVHLPKKYFKVNTKFSKDLNCIVYITGIGEFCFHPDFIRFQKIENQPFVSYILSGDAHVNLHN